MRDLKIQIFISRSYNSPKMSSPGWQGNPASHMRSGIWLSFFLLFRPFIPRVLSPSTLLRLSHTPAHFGNLAVGKEKNHGGGLSDVIRPGPRSSMYHFWSESLGKDVWLSSPVRARRVVWDGLPESFPTVTPMHTQVREPTSSPTSPLCREGN